MKSTLALVGLILVVESASSAPLPVKRSNRILYTAKKGAHYHLFVINPDGTGLTQLTKDHADYRFPAWSPDGKRLVCSVTRAGNQKLVLMNADGSGVTALTRGVGQDRAPAWSPDGKKIAFTRMAPNQVRDIYLIDVRSKTETNLTNSRSFDSDVTWSPDGKRIAFASDRAGDGFRVFVMDADGKNVRGVTKRGNNFGLVYPAWSPDGKRLVYADNAGGARELFVSDVDGSNAKQLTRMAGYSSYAAWTSKGDALYFQHHPRAGQDGFLYHLDLGTGKTTRFRPDRNCPIEGGRPAVRGR